MDIEKKTFMLCFTAVIWRRIFSSLMVYSEHKNIELCSNNILKCLKYNLLAPTGFVQKLKPYIIKALKNGFLMPKDFDDNIYIKKAIYLYRDAYNISKIRDDEYRRKEEIEFIHTYSSKIFSEENREENILEMSDLLNDTPDKTTISFCDLVDVWDIDLSLISSYDRYIELIKYFILSPLTC